MKSIKKIKLLIITGLLLQSSINLANSSNIEEESLSFISAAGLGNLEDIKIALDNPQINVNYQCGGIEGRNDVGCTALMYAADIGHTEVVRLLLKAGANPNIVDKSRLRDCELAYNFDIPKGGNTALMNAVTKGHVKVVTLLLEAGADPNIKTLDGTTPLMKAAQFKSRNDVEIVRILLSYKADLNIKRDKRNIVTFRPQADWTALMYAADKGHTEGVRLLLKAGANPNIKGKDGVTALINSAHNGHVDVVKELLDEKSYKPNMNVIEKIYNLFSMNNATNIDLNVANNHGMTALMWAADKGHTEIARLLLDAGADPNIKEKNDLTALMFAASRGNAEIVRLLLKAGANPNIKDNDGFTALIFAACIGNAEMVKALLNAHSDLNVQIKKTGMTALMKAADKGHVEVVRLLLDAGAHHNIKEYSFHRTALHYAEDCPHYEKRQEMVQLIKNAQKK
jgi:ankyrin repeat protein